MGTSVHSRREPGTAREEEEEDEWTQVRAENARRIRRAEARHMHRHTGRGLAQICVWGEDGNTSLSLLATPSVPVQGFKGALRLRRAASGILKECNDLNDLHG